MTRDTIDYGIDLGTTNSGIAVLDGTTVEIIRNNEGFETMPSSVWMDKRERVYVGRTAYERLEDDRENAFCEFKLQMGTGTEFAFARSGKKMRPEELSGEVLKALRADAARRRGEGLRAAVITVPAAFELPQCEATNKAARLAGFDQSPLLQEPVAAAMAYGFQSEGGKARWLVYDYGGGTFDSAVIEVQDGEIRVVNHGGDNHLGGKLIDWAIVEQKFVPALLKDRKLSDFRRGNPKWRAAFAKLKLQAEQAKIRVSSADSAMVMIDYLCNDDLGQPVSFEFELLRKDVEDLMEPFVLQSVNICKKVLADRRLGPERIERLLLLGGPTRAPYLRARLSDKRTGLGIPLDHSVDPMTVVARGAPVFAGTRRLAAAARAPVAVGAYGLDLGYSPVGADVAPIVGGRLVAPAGGGVPGGCPIEFVNQAMRPPWRSGAIALSQSGSFLASLLAEKGRENTFTIEVRDSKGGLLTTDPEQIRYTIGMVITETPLIHSIGVALANNEMGVFLGKGTPLPARKRCVLRTACGVNRDQEGDLIRIPVIGGENCARADRNRLVGMMAISGSKIRRNVAAGSEVEITLEIDQSRLVRANAYLPVLDQEFEEVLALEKKVISLQALKEQVQAEEKRLAEMRKKAGSTEGARDFFVRIDGERMMAEVNSAALAALDDPDAADRCQKRLLDLQQAVDGIEDALRWPALVEEAKQAIKDANDIVKQFGKADDKTNLVTLEGEVREAMTAQDAHLLRGKVDDLEGLRFRVLREQPAWWLGLLEHLETLRGKMTNSSEAARLISAGRQASSANDVSGLKGAAQGLIALLPAAERAQGGWSSTVQL